MLPNMYVEAALELLASAAYGAAASGKIDFITAHNVAKNALKLKSRGSIRSLPLDEIKEWFNDYECPACGHNKPSRQATLETLMVLDEDANLTNLLNSRSAGALK
jgi:hypothetical protein